MPCISPCYKHKFEMGGVWGGSIWVVVAMATDKRTDRQTDRLIASLHKAESAQFGAELNNEEPIYDMHYY